MKGLLKLQVLVKRCHLQLSDSLFQYCLGVPVTEAQQTYCLVDVFHEQSSQRKLRPRCEKIVKERIEMLSAAVKQVPLPEGLKGECH